MSKIPQEIKEVVRPGGSEVYFRNGKYNVRLYSSKRGLPRKDGTIRTKPAKVTGMTIGVIEEFDSKYVFRPNLKYVNLLNGIVEEEITDKEYGGSKVLFDEIKKYIPSLEKLFGKDITDFLCTIAILQVMYKNIKCYQLERKYRVSYISELLKGVCLSKNTISSNLESIGKHPERFKSFMISSIKDYSNLIVDGTLFATETSTNSLVAVGRRDKGIFHNQLNLIYVFDYVEKMPKYYEVFSGSTNDITGFINIYKNINLEKGIIVADRIFGTKGNRNRLTEDNIEYLFPLKENDEYYKKIINNKSLTIKKCYLNGEVYEIKQKRMMKNRYLTYFKDLSTALRKEKDYQNKILEKKEGFTKKGFEEIKDTFGVFVFESNKKYSAAKLAEIYDLRWSIEAMNDEYMNDLELDEINVQGVYRANTTFFINHLSLLIYYSIKNKKNVFDSYKKEPTMNFVDSLCDIRITKERGKWIIKNLSKKMNKSLTKLGFNL
jgi:hypothetical protein